MVIQIKRGNDIGKVSSLQPGELAITLNDGELYYGDSFGGVQPLNIKVQNVTGITIDANPPSSGDGQDGDFWFTYENP